LPPVTLDRQWLCVGEEDGLEFVIKTVSDQQPDVSLSCPTMSTTIYNVSSSISPFSPTVQRPEMFSSAYVEPWSLVVDLVLEKLCVVNVHFFELQAPAQSTRVFLLKSNFPVDIPQANPLPPLSNSTGTYSQQYPLLRVQVNIAMLG